MRGIKTKGHADAVVTVQAVAVNASKVQ